MRGREELRLQLGTLSFDLDTIINNSGDKKAGKAAKTALFKKVRSGQELWDGCCLENFVVYTRCGVELICVCRSMPSITP